MGIGNWLKKVEFFAPLVLPFVPGFPQQLNPYIIKGIQTAEQLPGASGADKLAAAVQIATTGIDAVNAVKPGTINAPAVNQAIVSGIQTVVAVTNAVHKPAPDVPVPGA